MVDIILREKVKLSITKPSKKYAIEVYDLNNKKLVTLLDSWENPLDSSYTRGRIRNETLKYIPDYDPTQFDKDLMAASLEKRDELRTL